MKKKETQAAYKRRLARVRAYSKDRAEWKKLQRMGNTTFSTLQEFRDAKYGKLESRRTEKEVEAISVPDPMDGDGKLERLLRTCQELQKVFRETPELKRLLA